MTNVAIEDVDGEPTAVVRGSFDSSTAQGVSERGVTRLELNRGKGWKPGPIEGLRSLTHLTWLRVIGTVPDITPVHALDRLEELVLPTWEQGRLDFAALPRLRACYLEWHGGAASVFDHRTLEDLYVYNYPDEDLRRPAGMPALRRLRIGPTRTLQSLRGIEDMLALSTLEIYQATSLGDVSDVADAPRLEELTFNTCRRITSLEALRPVIPRLRKLALSNCGEVESLDVLREARNLRELYFTESTKVLDGDIGVLLDLPMLERVAFRDRRHYSHRLEDLPFAPFGRSGGEAPGRR